MTEIHHTAIVSDHAEIGMNNYIGPYCTIGPGVIIGNNNRLESHVVIGSPAEKQGYFDKFGRVRIGNNNVIREFCTIQGGTEAKTIMANNCFMLRGSHLSHDSILEDSVSVSCNVMIGGESYIMRGANLGLGCALHQRTVIGSYTMIGMEAVITKKAIVWPGGVWVGNPAEFLKRNDVGLERYNVSDLSIDLVRFEELRSARL